MFSVVFYCWFVSLSVNPKRQQDYLHIYSNERICMKLVQDVCLGPRHNPLHFGDDRDYDMDSVYRIMWRQ